jgi:hypothetical protein
VVGADTQCAGAHAPGQPAEYGSQLPPLPLQYPIIHQCDWVAKACLSPTSNMHIYSNPMLQVQLQLQLQLWHESLAVALALALIPPRPQFAPPLNR